MWAYQARYRVPLSKAVAGNWVLLEGVDATSERRAVHAAPRTLRLFCLLPVPSPATMPRAAKPSCLLAAQTAALPAPACALPLPFPQPCFPPIVCPPAVAKTATIVPEFLDEEVHIFKPLAALTQAVVKIATEPLNPSELPKMVRGWCLFGGVIGGG